MGTLGERLKMARAMSGLSLRDVAAKAGVSHMAISKYERGLDMPSSPVLLVCDNCPTRLCSPCLNLRDRCWAQLAMAL